MIERDTKDPTYNTWTSMKQRCNNPKATGYRYYGGRGIKYCKRWEKFDNFLEDMGERPFHKTLDRINVNLSYNKRNCRWSTYREQCCNKRIIKKAHNPYIGIQLINNRWRVYITHDYKNLYFGSYDDNKEAAYIRDQVALQLRGKFTTTNFELL